MKTFEKMARQGDVVIVRCDRIPDGANPIKREGGKVVLAHGEVTGHMHAISEKHVQHFRVDDAMAQRVEDRTRLRAGGALAQTYLMVEGAPALLKHDEHEEIQIAPGTYIVRRQREYVRGEIRNVAD